MLGVFRLRRSACTGRIRLFKHARAGRRKRVRFGGSRVYAADRGACGRAVHLYVRRFGRQSEEPPCRNGVYCGRNGGTRCCRKLYRYDQRQRFLDFDAESKHHRTSYMRYADGFSEYFGRCRRDQFDHGGVFAYAERRGNRRI